MAETAVATPSASAATSAPGQGMQTQETPGEVSVNPYKGTKHKIKVDGAEMDIDYDDLISDHQLKKVSHKRLEEAAQLRKEVSDLMQGVQRGDPRAIEFFLKNAPRDVIDRMSEERIWKKMEYERLPDHEKKRLEVEERARQVEDRERQLDEGEKQKAWASEVQNAGQHLQRSIDEFYQKKGTKPTTPELLRISEYMRAQIKAGREIPPIDVIYERVMGDLDRDISDVVASRPVEELLKKLPKDVVASIKKHLLQDTVQAHQPSRYRESSKDAPPPKSKKAVNIDDAFVRLNKKFSNKGR